MPHCDEEILEKREAHILTDKRSIHLKAIKDMTDCYGIKRPAGSEWLIGIEQANAHILNVNEKFVKKVEITSLSNR